MKTMRLTQGKSTLVDDDVYEWASKRRWHAIKSNSGLWYAARRAVHDGKETREYLHRAIAGVPGLEVDHRDGDGLNNQRANLRAVTHQQNQRNRRYGYGKTGVRNVTLTKQGRFCVRLYPKSGPIGIGTFRTIEDAAEATRQARVLHFGEA